MRTAEELQDEVIRLDGQLAECRNLVSALFLLVDDLATTSMEDHGATLRDGIVGVTWALRREVGMQ
ncbi:hypothetical protein PARHAE_02506 [Paracoccus haematequi]|uniref:Uncharacterized protein n=1 Tax=Paracoccus haematequi TaxID=2491866 RepID=A0A447IP99_9RHOB|nr:hypothetical protein [Paracoccus haematequi]VDS09308.1 hypothetical protein PARHAE_02506 [Paracoccus haematequi]